jgi:AraC family transcriptional activator of pobA
MAPAVVPRVRLYVDRAREADNWFVHVGHVSDRGRWQTAPHAHPGYGQLIFVRNGRGVMNLEGRKVSFEGPCVLLLPAECIHGLNYEIDVDRWVVTIEAAFLSQVNSKLPAFAQIWAEHRIIPLSCAPEAATTCHNLIEKLQQEVGSRAIGLVAGAEALLTYLLLTLVRCAGLDQVDHESVRRHKFRLVDRFRELIEQHFRESLSLQEYTAMMAVSLPQLRAACMGATGQKPAKMIHARLLAEAKRNLIFGDMSIEQIAFSLGFSNSSYFARFFRKEVGQTAGQFRISAREWTARGK